MTLPTGPTSLQSTIPQYLYAQYQDDDNLQAFVVAYNQLAQEYVTWFNTVNLPVYSSPLVVGSLLDWVANGLYGIARPVFSNTQVRNFGPFNTQPFDKGAFNVKTTVVTGTYVLVSDDVYKRILTWNLYRGDGQQFTIRWLKNRILRFLLGVNGTDIPVGTNLFQFSISVLPGKSVLINLPLGFASATILTQAFASGALNLPPQYTFTVTAAAFAAFNYGAFNTFVGSYPSFQPAAITVSTSFLVGGNSLTGTYGYTVQAAFGASPTTPPSSWSAAATWGSYTTSPVALPGDVNYGWSINITAPSTPGTYYLWARAVISGTTYYQCLATAPLTVIP